MSSPRVRRLQSDYDRIATRFAGWPLVRVELAQGVPPDLYRIWYQIRGLYTTPDGRVLERDEHVLEIRLGLEYPRRAPQLRLLTPLFHPNFNETEVCAQDIYAASEGLDDLIIRIGRMIAYQEYNTKSPLNGIAARWASENSGRLPVDRREIAPPAVGADAVQRKAPVERPKPVSEEHSAYPVVITEGDVSTLGRGSHVEPPKLRCSRCGAWFTRENGGPVSPSGLAGMPSQSGNAPAMCPRCRKPLKPGRKAQPDKPQSPRRQTPIAKIADRQLQRQTAKDAYRRASALHAERRYDVAQPILDELLEAFPGNTQAMYAAALNLAAMGRTGEAIAIADSLVRDHGYQKAASLLEQLKSS